MGARQPRAKFVCKCGKVCTIEQAEWRRRNKRSKQPLSCSQRCAIELRRELLEQTKK